ncbi:MAG: phosphatase PAP2 family protein [Oscillospiraceae bacterium]|nr:phosphatase PAP2 family protein [Oscillospiraceae bacterium]
MEILYLLEKIRVPIVNEFMLLVTQLGEETAFLVIALILFWCVSKKTGYYVLSVGFVGTLANQFMKLWFRVPRPWVLDSNFTILEQAREAASGYSFPSGHTQSAVGTFGTIAHTTTNKWVRTTALVFAVLVPFSRMYIGVHTPSDVIVSAALAVALILLLRPVIFCEKRNYMPLLLAVMLALSGAYMCFISFYKFPENIDIHNLESGVKNAYTLLGALLGLICVYIADEKWLNFTTKAVWWAQILKVIGGLVLILAVKSGLKAPLNAWLGESVGRSARYFLIVLVAGIVWPLSFRWFSKLGKKEA